MEKEILKLKDQYKVKNGIKQDRSEIRRAKKEFENFQKEVDPLVSEFESELFESNNLLNYHSLYVYFLEKITKLCDWLNKNRYKIIEVDNYFFSETYKPLESI